MRVCVCACVRVCVCACVRVCVCACVRVCEVGRCPHESASHLFATAGDDLAVIVWDATSGKIVHKVACRTYPVALEWSPFSPTEICVAMRDKRSPTPARECGDDVAAAVAGIGAVAPFGLWCV
jgi:hypothetical protein